MKVAVKIALFLIVIGGLEAQASEYADVFWSRAVGGVVQGTPSAQAGSVTVAVDGGSVKCYSWRGDFLWEYFARGKLCPFITRSWDGVSYICRTSGVLIALNRTGQELWQADIQSPISSPIVAGWDGRVFVPTEKKIFCFNSEGKTLWTRDLADKTVVDPSLDREGGLLLALGNNDLLKISAFGKTEIRRLVSDPASLVSFFYNSKNIVLAIYKNGETDVCFFEDSEEFTAPSFPHFTASPLDAQEYRNQIAVALANGKLVMLANSGETLWSADTGVLSEGKVFNTGDGVYVLNKSRAIGFYRSGSVKWALNIERAATQPVFSEEGSLYSGGSDWILYAYQLENPGIHWDESVYGASPQGGYGLGELPAQKADYYNKFSEFDLSYQFGVIRKKMASGQMGEDEPLFVNYLKEAAGSMRYSLAIPEANPPVHLMSRVEAVRLLAAFASQELIPFFVDLFLGDREPQVKAAAAQAIGRIGVDPKGLAMQAFARTITPPLVSRDAQVLTAVALATGELCRFSGPPLIALGVPILAGLASGDKPVLVRKTALRELERLQRDQ